MGKEHMPNCKVTVMVENINLISNGDAPGSNANHSNGKKNNAITASLIYPRGGYPQITSVIQADLQSNVQYNFNTTNFFGPNGDGVNAPGLFKGEEIDQGCPLKVQVTANDDAGKLASFISKVFTGLLGSAVKLVPGGQVVGAVLGAVAGGIGDEISKESSGSVEVIGEASTPLNPAALLAGPNPLRMVLPLTAPQTIHKSWSEPQTPAEGGPIQIAQVEGDLVTKGQVNGMVHLVIATSPV
jgi:hypothetical protein